MSSSFSWLFISVDTSLTGKGCCTRGITKGFTGEIGFAVGACFTGEAGTCMTEFSDLEVFAGCSGEGEMSRVRLRFSFFVFLSFLCLCLWRFVGVGFGLAAGLLTELCVLVGVSWVVV